MKGNLLSSEEGSGQEAYDYSGDEVEESSVDATDADMDTRSGNVLGMQLIQSLCFTVTPLEIWRSVTVINRLLTV